MGRKLTGDRCKCSACGEYFNSTKAFDKHRRGKYMPNERRCLSKEEMEIKKMSLSEKGFWITDKMPSLPAWNG